MSFNPHIIAGTAKHTKLEVPASARPMTDRIKQSVFDTLAPRLAGAVCLDLFAGSGSIGLEALSRGAAYCTFVEADSEAIDMLKRNIAATKFTDQAQTKHMPVETFLAMANAEFDLVFADPPFIDAESFPIKQVMAAMAPNALLVFRKPTEAQVPEVPQELKLIHAQTYGESEVIFFHKHVSLEKI